MRIGAIFDWDGVIIDSSQCHEKSWNVLASEEGLSLPPGHFQKSFGMRNELIIPQILNWTDDPGEIHRLSLRKEALYREIMMKEELSPLPGVIEFLTVLKDLNIPCAVGSSTHRLNIQVALQQLGMGDFFDAIVCGEDVTEGKPSPQVFLIAAERIKCNPRHSVVFEDAPAGIAAAHNGGMKAVGIATTRPVKMLKDADIVVKSLDELNYSMLKELFCSIEGPAA
jgi:HAD superfamily hydrolase (TIGR01509 family)